MGNTACCSKDKEKTNEIISEQQYEKEQEVVRVRAINKFQNKENLVIKLQKKFRGAKALKQFIQVVDEDKFLILDHFESKKLFIEENFDNLLHNKVKQAEYDLSNRLKTFNNDNLPEDTYKPITYNSKFGLKLEAVWLNEEKNSAYKGYLNRYFKPNGYGILIKKDGSKYEGFFSDGKLNGFGRYFTIKGEFFEGNFIQGVASGKGIFIHPDGNIYKGDWHNDKTDGYGDEFFSDGSIFSGNFIKGKKNGKGKYEWKKDESFYEGEFKNDYLYGEGYYKWPDGSSYKGSWKLNLMNGKGFFVFPDGSTYEGDFVNNKRSGYGKYFWNENKYHIGQWKDGKQHGKGVYYKDGKSIEGIWYEGKYQSDEKKKNKTKQTKFNSNGNGNNVK